MKRILDGENIYCFICGLTHPLDECNEEHFIPYAIGNRRLSILVGRDCNSLVNKIFDSDFAKLDDILIERRINGNYDRRGNVAKPKTLGLKSQGGIETKYRIDVGDKGISPRAIEYPQRYYGTGPAIYKSEEPLEIENIQKAIRALDKFSAGLNSPSGLEMGRGLLHLPPIGMFDNELSQAKISIDARIRIQEVCKIFLGHLAFGIGKDIENFSFSKHLRDIMLCSDENTFDELYKMNKSRFRYGYSFIMPYPVPNRYGEYDEIALENSDLKEIGLLDSKIFLKKEDDGLHHFSLNLERIRIDSYGKMQDKALLIYRSRFYKSFAVTLVVNVSGRDIKTLESKTIKEMVVPYR